MKKQITRVSVAQSAKVAAALYFVISLPFVVLMLLSAMFAGGGVGMSVTMLIFGPILYAVFGFIFTAIFAWVYNLVAAKIGGIEYVSTEVA